MAQPSSKTSGAGLASTPLDTTSSEHLQSNTDVEMSTLDASKGSTTVGAGSQSNLLNDIDISTTPMASTFPASSEMPSTTIAADENTSPEQSSSTAISTEPASSTHPAPVAPTSTEDLSSSTPPAIAPSDSIPIDPATKTVSAATTSEAGPVLVITLLLTSGARHPYKIDEKYLTKRNVNVPGVTESGKKDPLSISVYTLKELILREWREEWEAQPSSPSSIRLIFFGRLLDDKTALKECRFNGESANVVHMTVRPQDIVDEEDASKGKQLTRDREGGESTAGCRCVIL